jgi:diguanylate cyclase (GGDEF)-like protein
MERHRALTPLFPHSYRAKLLAVVFGGTTLPLTVLAVWLLMHNGAPPGQVVVGTLVAVGVTLLGTVLTLVAIYRLFARVRNAADALDAYYDEHVLPHLPDLGEDEMGRLLRGINRCLYGIDAGVRELERHALQDALTGALNRRGCDRLLAEAVRVATAEAKPLVLAVADVDNLKPINDEYGHLAGDHALVSLVASAQRRLHRDEWIGRWGGDEFLVLLRDPLPSAIARITEWLNDLASPADGGLPVRISVGCASLHPGDDAAQLYRRADQAMYDAKFTGGGKLVAGDFLPSQQSIAVAPVAAAQHG